MPETKVVFYAEADGDSPVIMWLDTVPPKVQDKCFVRIERLEQCGHELRRPEADYLRDDVYELRIGFSGMNYRILYFFHKRLAVVVHGLVKEDKVPDRDIEVALKRRQMYMKDAQKHTYQEQDNKRQEQDDIKTVQNRV